MDNIEIAKTLTAVVVQLNDLLPQIPPGATLNVMKAIGELESATTTTIEAR